MGYSSSERRRLTELGRRFQPLKQIVAGAALAAARAGFSRQLWATGDGRRGRAELPIALDEGCRLIGDERGATLPALSTARGPQAA